MAGDHRRVNPDTLIGILNDVIERWPDARLTRSRGGTGNLAVLDNAGDYVGLVVVRNPPKLWRWNGDAESSFVMSANWPDGVLGSG